MRGIKMTDPLFDVSDKIVIITGGLGQIGAEFVKEFYNFYIYNYKIQDQLKEI